MTRGRLIAGNWKMNGLREDARALAKSVAEGAAAVDATLLVCPPFPLLAPVGEVLAGSGVLLGAQDCHSAQSGAHTGDVSAWLLRDLGCSHVILGHSERRTDHAETDAQVAAKAAAAHAAGLTAIICVGETEAERDAGRTEAVIAAQLAASLPVSATAENTVIAYEPVWAIGTGRTPSPEEADAVHAAIRGDLGARMDAKAAGILYGGSMKPGNAASLLACAHIDGGLIGGASLVAENFLAIAAAG
jgi:triosephosphate isomerase